MDLVACFQMTEATNHTIRLGIVIAGKCTWVRQMQKEPRRCLKCQSLTARHLTTDCNHCVTCSTCSKEHCTAECTETTRDSFWCVNCNSLGHASWDRLCLTFLEA